MPKTLKDESGPGLGLDGGPGLVLVLTLESSSFVNTNVSSIREMGL